MVRRGQGTWQQSPSYLRDQERIERLVHHVGRATLCFTAYDVAREARRSTSLRLEESQHLNRHLKSLTSAVLRVVSPTLRVDAGGDGGTRAVKRYILASRYAEWEQSGGGLTDREKVLAALWIACAVLQVPHVPTIAVTRVLQLVPALALSTTVQTHVVLAVLADGPDPVEREEVAEAVPWCHWRLMGTVQHPRLDAWVQLVRDIVRVEGPAVLSAHPSRNQLVQRLVAHAIQRFDPRDWPFGKLVSAQDLREHAAADATARALLSRVLQGGSLGAAIQQAARVSPSGTSAITRVVMPGAARTILYDVPTLPGSAARLAVADLMATDAHCTEDRLLLWDRERREAHTYANAAGPLGAIGSVRLYMLGMEWSQVTTGLARAASVGPDLGRGGQRLLKQIRARLDGYEKLAAVAARSQAPAHAAMRVIGIDPLTWAVSMPRPYLSAREYVGYCPPGEFGNDSPATVLARQVSLTRWPNPRHTRKTDTDPDCAATVVVDRVSGLVQLAERGRSEALAWLQRGQHLLGPFLRDARFVKPLLDGQFPQEVQARALAALVLLGDPSAAEWAHARLRDTATSPDVCCVSLYALHILQRDAFEIPLDVRRTRHPLVMRAVRSIVDARRRSRWLLQR